MIWRSARQSQAFANYRDAHWRRHGALGRGGDYVAPARAPRYWHTVPGSGGLGHPPWREHRLVEARPTGYVLQQARAAADAVQDEARADADLRRAWNASGARGPWTRFLSRVLDDEESTARLRGAARRAFRAERTS